MKRKNYHAAFMSCDYQRLMALLDDGNVVACFVDYPYRTGDRTVTYRDIAKARSNDYNPNTKNYGYTVEARGIVYLSWDRRMADLRDVSFEDMCREINLQYIDYAEY